VSCRTRLAASAGEALTSLQRRGMVGAEDPLAVGEDALEELNRIGASGSQVRRSQVDAGSKRGAILRA